MPHAMSDDQDRQHAYRSLVQARKECTRCGEGIINPAHCCGGRFDGEEIGPWSRWQGNLNARLMVIGQDWGDNVTFERNGGVSRSNNPTNRTLIRLMAAAGLHLGPPEATGSGAREAFFTNAVLCLKTKGGLQGDVQRIWFDNCGTKFLLPLIRLVNPPFVVTLGERAYRVLEELFHLPYRPFRQMVEDPTGISIRETTRLFPRYHCGNRILRTHRNMEQQLADWTRLRPFLKS